MGVRQITRAGFIASVYVCLCLLLSPISYGPFQIRFSEAMTLLPIFCPEAVLGLTLGCFLANMIGGMPIDMLVGTLATLLAALATRKLRHHRFKGLPLLACLPPILLNGVIVGTELTFLFPMEAYAPLANWGFYMMTVSVGQVISVCGLGLPLVWAIEKNPRLLRLMCDTPQHIRK